MYIHSRCCKFILHCRTHYCFVFYCFEFFLQIFLTIVRTVVAAFPYQPCSVSVNLTLAFLWQLYLIWYSSLLAVTTHCSYTRPTAVCWRWNCFHIEYVDGQKSNWKEAREDRSNDSPVNITFPYGDRSFDFQRQTRPSSSDPARQLSIPCDVIMTSEDGATWCVIISRRTPMRSVTARRPWQCKSSPPASFGVVIPQRYVVSAANSSALSLK